MNKFTLLALLGAVSAIQLDSMKSIKSLQNILAQDKTTITSEEIDRIFKEAQALKLADEAG